MTAIKKKIKKAQAGDTVKATKDSTDYYLGNMMYGVGVAANAKGPNRVADSTAGMNLAAKAYQAAARQGNKGKPGYDENGFRKKPTVPKKKCGGKVKKKK